MDLKTLSSFLDNKNRSQRERLGILASEWSSILAAMSDDDLYAALRLIRKVINSKKLKGERDELVGALRRDGEPGSAPLAKPPPPTEAEPNAAIEEVGAPDENRNADLEAQIAADPRGREHYLVYRDWLEERDLVRDGRVTLGAAAELDDMISDIEWRNGFLHKCHVKYTSARFNGERPNISIEKVLELLLDSPGPARFIQDLTIGLVRHDDNHYAGVCRAIGARTRPALEKLYLGDFDYEECELNWTSIDEAEAMWPALPRLRELTLRAGSMSLGTIVLPELRQFSTISGGMSEDSVRSVATATWPKLVRLSLQIGPVREGACSNVDALTPLFETKGVAELRHLGIANCSFTDAVCERLAGSRILPQLETLDLSMGTMGVEGARILSQNAQRFSHLERINLDDNYLNDEAIMLVRQICDTVIIGDQRSDDGDPEKRYASMYE